METISQDKTGSALGGILLIAGCSIGGGMIGLPVVSAYAGFIPSSLVLLLCSFFMTCTGLLLLEAVLWFNKEVSLISLAKTYLGKFGEKITWSTFLFIFYCLLIAYSAASGELIGDFLSILFGRQIPHAVGSLLCVALVGSSIIFGTRRVDQVNSLFMIGLVLSYGLLVGLGAAYVQPENLMQMQWKSALPCIPIMLISFGFHNMIPTLVTYLKRNVNALRVAIIVGNLIPLVFYLVWQTVILGILPGNGDKEFQEILSQSNMATGLLKGVTGSPLVFVFAHTFAFFAIITSFITISLSCVDFLADGFSVKKTFKVRTLLCSMILLPPLFLAFSFPHLFLKALGYAGGFATVILFGILPALIVWRGRYVKNHIGERLLPGGRATLTVIIVLAYFFLSLELNQQIKLF